MSYANNYLIDRFLVWQRVLNYSESTVGNRARHLRALSKFLGSRSVCAATRRDLSAYLASRFMGKPLQDDIGALKAFFSFLALGNIRRDNPALLIPTPKQRQRLPRFLNPSQMESLIHAAETPLERALIEFLFATGCRRGELPGIQVERVAWKDRSLVVTGKGRKDRIVFFGRSASIALREYLAGRDTGLLFPKGTDFAQIVRRVGKRAGLGRVYPHLVRHSFASALINHGMDIRHIQCLLGHSSASTTQRYTRVELSEIQNQHQKGFK